MRDRVEYTEALSSRTGSIPPLADAATDVDAATAAAAAGRRLPCLVRVLPDLLRSIKSKRREERDNGDGEGEVWDGGGEVSGGWKWRREIRRGRKRNGWERNGWKKGTVVDVDVDGGMWMKEGKGMEKDDVDMCSHGGDARRIRIETWVNGKSNLSREVFYLSLFLSLSFSSHAISRPSSSPGGCKPTCLCECQFLHRRSMAVIPS